MEAQRTRDFCRVRKVVNKYFEARLPALGASPDDNDVEDRITESINQTTDRDQPNDS